MYYECLEVVLSSGLDGVRFMVGLDELKDVFQPKGLYDCIIKCQPKLKSTQHEKVS